MSKLNKDYLLKVTGIECPHWTTIALWTLGILIMTGLMANDLCPILYDYFDDNENEQVKIETKSWNASGRPKLHVCVPLASSGHFDEFAHALRMHLTKGTPCPECELMTNHSFDVWTHCPDITDTPADSRSFSPHLVLCIAKELIKNSTKPGIISIENLSWNRPILSSLTDILNVVETYLENDPTYEPYPENPSIRLFTNRYTLEGLDTMNRMLISFLCELIWIGDRSNMNENTCLEIMHGIVSIVHPQGNSAISICAELSPLHASANIPDVKVRDTYFHHYMDGRRQFLIYTDNPAHDARAQALYSTPQKETSDVRYEGVTITYAQQTSVVEGRPHKFHSCYRESSINECLWNCRVDRMESICQCRFFLNRTLRGHDDGKDPSPKYDAEYCNRELISNCSQRNQFDTQNCNVRCKNSCESVSFQWQVNTDMEHREEFVPAFDLRIQAREQPYLVFTTKVRDSKQDLISKVGGVFNFYLGLSGLSIVFFLIYIIDSGRRLQRLKQAKDNVRAATVNEEGGRRPSFGLWRFRWMQLAASAVEMSSKESELKTEIFQLESRLKEAEAAHKQGMSELVKINASLQAQNRVVIEEVREIKLHLAHRGSPFVDQAGQNVPIVSDRSS